MVPSSAGRINRSNPGSQCFSEIKTALTNTKVAVLLVTPDFLASDFIHAHELGPLLKQAERDGVKILWVPVHDCAYMETALKSYQAVLDPNKPLATWPKAKRNQGWVKICDEIKNAVLVRRFLAHPVNEDHNILPDGVSPLRFMMADAAGVEFRHCKTLSEARTISDAVAIMEGDYGGQIYFTCPVRHISCDADTLARLLTDLDALGWNDPEGAGLYFEVASLAAGIAGGMGGGAVSDGVWLHPELERHRASVEAVVAGTQPSINSNETGNA